MRRFWGSRPVPRRGPVSAQEPVLARILPVAARSTPSGGPKGALFELGVAADAFLTAPGTSASP